MKDASLCAPLAKTTLELVTAKAIDCPSAIAVAAPGRPPLSYAALAQQVLTLVVTLQSFGVHKNSRVAVVLPNGPEMATVFLGTTACAVCAPLNPAYRAQELRFYLQDLRVTVVIVRAGEGGAICDVAKELGLSILEIEFNNKLPAGMFDIRTTPSGYPGPHQAMGVNDTALILHTSGTTAKPKIVPLTHGNLLASADNIARHLMLRPTDICLNVMPLFHIHGLVAALLSSISASASVVCTPGFDEQVFFDWIDMFQPTWYTAVPTVHQSVVSHGISYKSKAPAHRR